MSASMSHSSRRAMRSFAGELPPTCVKIQIFARSLDTYVKGPEKSKESWPEFALQSPEVEGVLLLDGEVAGVEELATTEIVAAAL